MKKFLMFFAFCLVLASVFTLRSIAYETETEESLADMAGADDIESPYLDRDELNGDRTVNIFEKALNIISDSLKDNGITVIKSFGALLGVIVLSCVMGAMKFGSDALDTACGYISVLAISGVAYSILYNLFIFVSASMEALTVAMSSLMPVMASLYVFGGNYASGAASASALVLFLSILTVICSKILLPMLRISFGLSLSGAMPGSVNLSSVNGLVKNTATTVMAFIFTLLGFVLYLQTIVAAASDSFFTRSVRFASGVFVPVIGGILGDASRTVISSVSVIKGTVGATGVTVILSIILPPLLVVVLYKLMLLGCSVIAKALGCESESRLLYDLGGIVSVLMALVLGAGAVCLIALAIFCRSGITA